MVSRTRDCVSPIRSKICSSRYGQSIFRRALWQQIYSPFSSVMTPRFFKVTRMRDNSLRSNAGYDFSHSLRSSWPDMGCVCNSSAIESPAPCSFQGRGVKSRMLLGMFECFFIGSPTFDRCIDAFIFGFRFAVPVLSSDALRRPGPAAMRRVLSGFMIA